jgi:ubiquinone/menaquinone biosynthesis C-methylase UbiE
MQTDFLRMNESFKENSFDLIIEKAGLDSIATKESPDVPYQLKEIYNQIYTVLRPGGFVLSFSIKNPEFWHKNVFEHITKMNLFRVIQQVVTVFTIDKNPTLMNLYFYQLITLKK